MRIRRFLSFFIAIAMVILLCVSCNKNNDKKEHEGEIIVATWNKGNIWSGDITEWVNYFYAHNYEYIKNNQMTMDKVIKLGINAYCLIPLLEDYLKSIGESVSEESIELAALNYMAQIDYTYQDEGGYNAWKDGIGVTDNFIYELTKYGIYTSKVRERLVSELEVSDNQLIEYFAENSMNYATPVGYVFNTALIEVLDQADDEEVANAFEDAKAFIEKAKSGTSFSDIQKQILEKYTQEDGYTLAPYYTTDGTFSKTDLDAMPKFDDLDKYLEELEAKYTEKGMDKNADKKSEAYGFYNEYLFYVYQGTVVNIFRNKLLEIGETYDTPIHSPNGWMIVEYERYNENPLAKFEDVKDQVKEDYIASIEDSLLDKYCGELLERNNLAYENVEFIPNEVTAAETTAAVTQQ